jgi:S-adenosylmethionine decarboxylase proenzyme
MRPKADDGIRTIGYEVLAEFSPPMECFNEAKLLDHMKDAAERAGLNVRTSLIYHFEPIGVTATVILAESHATVSTWPEFNYMAIDVFSCTTPQSCARFIREFCACFGEGEIRGLFIRRPFAVTLFDTKAFRGLESLDHIAETYHPTYPR